MLFDFRDIRIKVKSLVFLVVFCWRFWWVNMLRFTMVQWRGISDESQNVPFRAAKRTVTHNKTCRFRRWNGTFCYVREPVNGHLALHVMPSFSAFCGVSMTSVSRWAAAFATGSISKNMNKSLFVSLYCLWLLISCLVWLRSKTYDICMRPCRNGMFRRPGRERAIYFHGGLNWWQI